jgi:hypothetical protein
MLRRLRFSEPSRRRLLLAGIAVTLFALWFGVFLRIKPAKPRMVIGVGEGLGEPEVSPDSSFLITRGARFSGSLNLEGVRIHDLSTGKLIANDRAANGRPGRVVVAPDGRSVAIEILHSESRRWTAFDSSTGTEIARIPSIFPFSKPGFSPDGSLLAHERVCRHEGKIEYCVIVRDTPNPEAIRELRGVCGPICFSPDGKTLAAVRSWLERSGEPWVVTIHLWDPTHGEEISVLKDISRRLEQMEFSPDGRFLIAATERNSHPSSAREVFLWSVKTSKLLHHWSGVRDFCFVPGVSRLCLRGNSLYSPPAFQHWELPESAENEPRLVWMQEKSFKSWTGCYDLESHPTTWAPHPLRVWAMETFFGAQEPKYRYTTSIQLTDWQGQSRYIETEGSAHAQLSPDEKTLLVSHSDGHVELYDVPPARPVGAFALFSGIASLLFTFVLWWRLVR